MKSLIYCVFVSFMLVAASGTVSAEANFWITVLHGDETTGAVWLAYWKTNNQKVMIGEQVLVRADYEGDIFPILLRDGNTFRLPEDQRWITDPGRIPMLSTLWEVETIMEQLGQRPGLPDLDPSPGLIYFRTGSVMLIGRCSGHWEWRDSKAQCMNARSAPAPLAEAWQSWSDMDRLWLLMLLDEYHHFPHYRCITDCSKSDSTDDNPPYLADQDVQIASRLRQLPAASPTALRHLSKGMEIMTEMDFMHAAKSSENAEAAIHEFSEALKVAPWWGKAYLNRAIAEEFAGYDRLAYADYRRCLMLNQTPEEAAKARKGMENLRATGEQ